VKFLVTPDTKELIFEKHLESQYSIGVLVLF